MDFQILAQLSVVGLMMGALYALTAKGLFIVNCPFSHRKQVDPIVNPGPSGTPSTTGALP